MRVAVGIPTICNELGYRSLIKNLKDQRGLGLTVLTVANSVQAEGYTLDAGWHRAINCPGHNAGVAASWNLCCREAFSKPDLDKIVLINDDVVLRDSEVLRDLVAYVQNGVILTEHRFACFVLHRDVFKWVGPFDEQFWPAYYEDIDYVYRCKLFGVNLWDWKSSGRIHHQSRSTLISGKEDLVTLVSNNIPKNRELYQQKWGGDQGCEQWSIPYKGA